MNEELELIQNLQAIKAEKDAKVVAENLKVGVTAFNVEGSFTSDADAKANEILAGKTAYVNGEKIEGTITDNGEKEFTPSTSEQSSGAGYYSSVKVAAVTADIDSNIAPNNIKKGVTILGVEGNVEQDKPDQEKEVTPTTADQEVFADTGYELGKVTVKGVTAAIDSNIKAANIKAGTTILGVEGTLSELTETDYEEALALCGDILGVNSNNPESLAQFIQDNINTLSGSDSTSTSQIRNTKNLKSFNELNPNWKDHVTMPAGYENVLDSIADIVIGNYNFKGTFDYNGVMTFFVCTENKFIDGDPQGSINGVDVPIPYYCAAANIIDNYYIGYNTRFDGRGDINLPLIADAVKAGKTLTISLPSYDDMMGMM